MDDVLVRDDLAGVADLFSPARRPDPYPMYASLRSQRPVWRPSEDLLVLSRHRDCAAVLRDPRFGHLEADAPRGPSRRVAGTPDGERPPVRSFLVLNPPDHTRLRRLVSRSFTPRRVEGLVPRMEELTASLLDGLAGRESVDLVESFASPLPVSVICELFGVPEEDRPRLVEWSHELARALDPAFLIPEDERRRQGSARGEFASYLVDLAAARRRAPGEDLISDLALTAVSHGTGGTDAPLTDAELVATCILLLIAGHETTTSVIANGVLALLRNPDQLERLRREPALLPGAVEELLRYDGPVQVTMRVALSDAEAAGEAVAEGSFVLMLLASANRDPDAHDDPDRLDIGREATPHLAFGHGIHFCLGAPLARLEAQVALRALTERFTRIELADEPRWKDMAILRGLARLDVRLTPSTRPADPSPAVTREPQDPAEGPG